MLIAVDCVYIDKKVRDMVEIEGEDHHYLRVVPEILSVMYEHGSLVKRCVVDILDRSQLDPTGTGTETNIVCDKVEDLIGGHKYKIAHEIRASVLRSLCL